MYKILKNDTPQKLELDVQRYLKNGWAVAGGVVISPEGIFYQAVYNATKIAFHKKKP